jgi:hypothetical protein
MVIVDIVRELVFTLPGAKLAGPVQAYVAPVTAAVAMVNGSPAHGAFTVTVGIAGIAFITTSVLDVDVQPFKVTVNIYLPLIATVVGVNIGFCVLFV